MTSSWVDRLLPPLSRRQALRQVLGAAAATAGARALPLDLRPGLGARPTAAPGDRVAALRPTIHPRSAWAGTRPVKGTIVPETDVRILLVHHTASTNDYTQAQVPAQIQGFYDFHTGAEKGWPDVAYNFFVDRFGGIWEGRQGSLAGAVRGDATGGSQGFSQLCSLIGNFQEAPVTAAQQASLTQLLAWLAERYAIDTSPGATVGFVSRGSNRWPAGARVTATTISGHRDMSLTSCPGDHAYDLVAQTLPSGASALRAAVPGTPAVAAAPAGTDPPAATPATDPAGAGSPGVDDEAPPTTAGGSGTDGSRPPLGHEAAPGTSIGTGTGTGTDDAAAPRAGSGTAGAPNPATRSRVALLGGAGASAAAGLSGLVVGLRRRSTRHLAPAGPPATPANPGATHRWEDRAPDPADTAASHRWEDRAPEPADRGGRVEPRAGEGADLSAAGSRPAWLAASDALQPSAPRLGPGGTPLETPDS